MFLVEVGKKHETDKVGHGYLDIYQKLWQDRKDEELTLLELGVYNGHSMETWCEWFPNAKIIGVDLVHNPMETDRADIRFGDATDPEFLSTIIADYPYFDIIIDDASHVWHDQQKSWDLLWPYVRSGGMYIIEDLGTSGDERWQRGAELDTASYFTKLAEHLVVHGNRDIHSIQFYEELIVITKK